MDFQPTHVLPAHEHITYSRRPEQPDADGRNDFPNDQAFEHDKQAEFYPAFGFVHGSSRLSASGHLGALDFHAAPNNPDSASLAWDRSGLETYIDGYDPKLFTLDSSGLFDQSFEQTWPYPATLDASIGPIDDNEDFSHKSHNDVSNVTAWSPSAIAPPLYLVDPDHRERALQQPTTILAPKSRRTRISKAAKKILDEHFSSNPYPDEKETSYLERATELSSRIIKTWYSNTRSRRKVVAPIPMQTLLKSFNDEVQASLRCASPSQSVCRASLEVLEKHSSIASISSLQRYIETPATEEAVSMETVDTIMRQYIETTDLHQLSGTTLNEQYTIPSFRPASSQRSYSIAGSKSSRGSAKSHTTQNSFKSRDSRGSRRGRKLWRRAGRQGDQDPPLFPNSPRARSLISKVPAILERADSDKGVVALQSYFCTVPSCNASFMFRYQWARHEEALHHEPYHWICCRPYVDTRPITRCFVCHEQNTTVGHVMTEHFVACMYKPREEVTFLREDQFLQHINTHVQNPAVLEPATKATCRELLSLCKVDNADMQSSALHCGFCGGAFSTWAERQDHVFKHLKSGFCKSAWWPGRLSLPSAVETSIGGCNNCAFLSKDCTVDPVNHPNCVAWSCRYLLDHHSLFVTGFTDQDVTGKTVILKSVCKLCKSEVCSTEDDSDYKDYKRQIQRHADTHHLRSCRQEQFCNQKAFISHLTAEHGALWSPVLTYMLESWKCRQTMEFYDGVITVRTFQAFQPSHICSSKVPAIDNEPFHLRHLPTLTWT